MEVPGLLPHQADIIVSILEAAHADEPSVSLVDILKSYEAVLRKHGLDPAADTFYYRFLLQLSLNPSPTFWHKLESELKVRSCSVGKAFHPSTISISVFADSHSSILVCLPTQSCRKLDALWILASVCI